MIDKPFAAIIGVATFIYVGSIFMEGTPQGRIEQSCAPVRWTGNIMGSIAALTDSDKLTQSISSGTDNFDYGCQFTVWRLVYGKSYSESLSRKEGGQVVGQQHVGGSSGFVIQDQSGVLPPGGIVPQEKANPVRVQSDMPAGAAIEHVMLVEKKK